MAYCLTSFSPSEDDVPIGLSGVSYSKWMLLLEHSQRRAFKVLLLLMFRMLLLWGEGTEFVGIYELKANYGLLAI